MEPQKRKREKSEEEGEESKRARFMETVKKLHTDRAKTRLRAADRNTLCKNPNPPMSEDVDDQGNRVPVRTWGSPSLVWGGDNVPYKQLHSFRTEFRWFTKERLHNIIVPFLRRGAAGGKGAAEDRQAVLSLRTLETFMEQISKERSIFFAIDIGNGPEWIFPNRVYADIMHKYNRSGVDTVRRKARCYFRDTDGTLYSTTIPQLTLLRIAWCTGIIYTTCLMRDKVNAWKSEVRKRQKEIKRHCPNKRVRIPRRERKTGIVLNQAKEADVVFRGTGYGVIVGDLSEGDRTVQGALGCPSERM